MSHPGFGHLWQQAEVSDVTIMLSDVEGAPPSADEAPEAQNSTPVVSSFPGHSQILSLSPYFLAQVLRWSTAPQLQDSNQPDGTAGSSQHAKKQVIVPLPDVSYEAAAQAVLAGMYQVEPWSKLLADLTPQQQVQAAVLADMWQLPAATEAAVGLLQSAAVVADKLSGVQEQLLSLAAVPDCLLPLFEQSLLSKYGDLEAVWDPANDALQKSLLRLPLHAMRLLLASDKLQVSSEDTVLYTAQAYVGLVRYADPTSDKAKSSQQAMEALAPLVRCPHLSQFWLSASVLSGDAGRRLLRSFQPQLKRLLLLKLTYSSRARPSAKDIRDSVSDILDAALPVSWLLPVRNIQPVSSVVVHWKLDVAAISKAATDTAAQGCTTVLRSPPSSLLGGLRFVIELQCTHETSRDGARGSGIRVYALTMRPGLPCGAVLSCTYILECVSDPTKRMRWVGPASLHTRDMGVWGRRDFFEVGVMPGGFDEAVWAAKGLPTSGSIVLQLTVKDLGM